MQYFDLPTIKKSIEALQGISADYLIPSFVFAANDVGTAELVDLSKKLGTDRFLDNYFNGDLIGLPPFPTGNNLMRPRLKGIQGKIADDYVIRQNTKAWGNLFSSRGYREMLQRGELEGMEGKNTTVRLTDTFKNAFENKIPASFQFEDFLVWLFAFKGFSDEIKSWQELFNYLLTNQFGISEFQIPYQGRFKLTPDLQWPNTINMRPTNDEFQRELAPGLLATLATNIASSSIPSDQYTPPLLSSDHPVLATIRSAIANNLSRSFLLAGPPGTGKTYLAHAIAEDLADSDLERILFIQFHPAFGYDDFVEGFRPAEANSDASKNGITYVLEDRHFLKIAEKARKQPEKLFVIVIDELNRGDVARIFGELLTYLELDYRDKEFTLAISGKLISLPRNLVVLATANPFDRSVTDLDDALLRRFIVILMEPDKVFLEKYLNDAGVENRVLRRVLRMFDILNEALPAGFGHTNFLKVRTIEDLAEVWTGRVQLGLQRTLFHEQQRYKDIKAEIESLLKIDEEAEATDEGNTNT